MKQIRTLAFSILILAIIYFTVVFVSYKTYLTLVETFVYYGLPPETIWQYEASVKTVQTLWFAIALFSILGVVAVTNSIGIFLAKEWARKLWLKTSIFLFVVHCLRFAVDFFLIFFLNLNYGWLILLLRIGEVLGMGFFAFFPRRYLQKDTTRIYFK